MIAFFRLLSTAIDRRSLSSVHLADTERDYQRATCILDLKGCIRKWMNLAPAHELVIFTYGFEGVTTQGQILDGSYHPLEHHAESLLVGSHIYWTSEQTAPSFAPPA